MPTFISKKGVWYAAKEKVGGLIYKGKKSIPKSELPPSILIAGEVLNPGDPIIYDGVDREALKLLGREGYDMNGDMVIGTDFRHDVEFLQSVRNMGFQNADEYLKHLGYDEQKDEEDFKQKAERIKSHEVAQKVSEIKIIAGGKNMAGEGDFIGGFGEEKLRPAKEVASG